ncbi:MAG: hypothetical protein MZV65_53095 [Chromatiales bacterium]|nr:hypothetical protein [Chromatiales bacterium]
MATNDEVRSWFCEGVNAPAEGRAIITQYMLAFLNAQLASERRTTSRMLTPGWALTRETEIAVLRDRSGAGQSSAAA